MKIIVPLFIIALVVLTVVLDTQRRQAQTELRNLTVRLEQLQGNNQENQERAKQVLQRVRALIEITSDVEPTVASIVDVEKLRGQNPFYNGAENGDYLIVTPTRAILYDPDKNVIIDVVPVQIQQNQPSSAPATN